MQIDWSGIRAAAVALRSVHAAAVQAAADLPADEAKRLVNRIDKRAYRERWLERAGEMSNSAPTNAIALSKPVQNGSDLLAKTLSRRKDKSALHLSRYVVQASKKAADSKGDLALAQDVRHVAGVRSHLWPQDRQGDIIDLHILSIGGNVNLSAK
jgi:hypothetical protein